MSKREFLEQLRQALEGEVSQDVIEQNIRYYDEYITSNINQNEDIIFQELGDPRLIAKTIIETEKISKNKVKYTSGQSYTDNRYYEDTQDENRKTFNGYQRNKSQKNRIFINPLKWYHKAILYTILILILFIIFIVGRFIIKMLFVFAIPLLLMWLVFGLFRKR